MESAIGSRTERYTERPRQACSNLAQAVILRANDPDGRKAEAHAAGDNNLMELEIECWRRMPEDYLASAAYTVLDFANRRLPLEVPGTDRVEQWATNAGSKYVTATTARKDEYIRMQDENRSQES